MGKVTLHVGEVRAQAESARAGLVAKPSAATERKRHVGAGHAARKSEDKKSRWSERRDASATDRSLACRSNDGSGGKEEEEGGDGLFVGVTMQRLGETRRALASRRGSRREAER